MSYVGSPLGIDGERLPNYGGYLDALNVRAQRVMQNGKQVGATVPRRDCVPYAAPPRHIADIVAGGESPGIIHDGPGVVHYKAGETLPPEAVHGDLESEPRSAKQLQGLKGDLAGPFDLSGGSATVKQYHGDRTEPRMNATYLAYALFDEDHLEEALRVADVRLRTGEEHPQAQERVDHALDVLWKKSSEETKMHYCARAARLAYRLGLVVRKPLVR